MNDEIHCVMYYLFLKNEWTNLESIEIPNSISTIGDCAFYGCNGLTSITIENNINTLGDDIHEVYGTDYPSYNTVLYECLKHLEIQRKGSH